MTENEQKAAASQFVKDWTGRGDEKQDTQSFWLALLRNVFGVEEPEKHIQFEVKVKLSHTSFIDAYLPDTNVLIEQKGKDIDLSKGIRQSDGSLLTPYQQARRYAGYLPHDKNPRWIIVCNFREFHIHDMNRPNDTPEVIELKDFAKEFYRFNFLVDTGSDRIQKEMEISLQAGELVGKLYDALLKQYHDPASEEELKSLNILCVRLVFCLYAEDAGIFGRHNMFHDYLKKKADADVGSVRKALKELFLILDQKVEDRDPYEMDEDLAAFPYVNGGLFANEKVIIPTFTQEIVDLLLSKASEDFNWSDISPTIFGAVFESTLNPKTRRSGGMHYTSIENIHKVIDPLFLNDLTAELKEVSKESVKKTRDRKLQDFQKKLAGLTFLDPACGSGNFLTETYLSLRRLENKAVALRLGDQIVLGDTADFNPIQVSIGQFYGIEINDFAVTVAKTALWIAESQMMQETEKIVHMHLEFLPLKSYVNIVEANALTYNWQSLVTPDKISFLFGNPPFVGKKEQNKSQKADLRNVFGKNTIGVGNVDYVTGWYVKAAEYIHGSEIHVGFVSTNSITQGEQPAIIWRKLNQLNIEIIFAYKSFVWISESKDEAAVHCVIIGFREKRTNIPIQKLLYSETHVTKVDNINPYLFDAPQVLISSRSTPICDVPEMCYGSMPIDNGNLILNAEDVAIALAEDSKNKRFIREYVGGEELLKGKKRWCLWLDGIQPEEYWDSKFIMSHIEANRKYRLYESDRPQTVKAAETPHLFGEIRQPENGALVVPKVSSKDRKYIPISYVKPGIIINGSALMIPNASMYHFGILSSNVHNAWMRVVAGRMKSDYQYSAKVVYNNFPWPSPSKGQKEDIEKAAIQLLTVREKHQGISLAKMYNSANFLLLSDLKKAHDQLNLAVMKAYGFWGKLNTETECVAALMKMYQELTR